MFPCHFKIPGHSETDFKHRKPFQKLKEYLNKKKRTALTPLKANPSIHFNKRNASPFSYNLVDRSLKWIIALIKLSLFLIIFLLIKNIAKSFYTDLIIETEKIHGYHAYNNGLTYIKTYNFLISMGNDYLDTNRLDEAHKVFAKAWNMDRYGFEANLGMTKTLLKKCDKTGEYCTEAEDYFKYKKKVTKLPDIDMNDLEKLYVAK